MSLEEILKMLEGIPGGEKIAESIKAFVGTKEIDIAKKTSELISLRAKLKGSESRNKAISEKNEAIYDALGIDPEVDDIEEAIKESLKNKSADPALSKQLSKLQKKLAEDTKMLSDQLTEERNKRYDGMKRTAILEALSANNAVDPKALQEMFLGKIKIDEDDESLSFLDESGASVNLNDGVKTWLGANPWAVANKQNSGAGSLPGGSAGGSEDSVSEFAKRLAEGNKTTSEDSAKALQNYFG